MVGLPPGAGRGSNFGGIADCRACSGVWRSAEGDGDSGASGDDTIWRKSTGKYVEDIVYVWACVCVCVCMYAYAYMHACVYVRMYVFMCVHVCGLYVDVCFLCMYVRMHVHLQTVKMQLYVYSSS